MDKKQKQILNWCLVGLAVVGVLGSIIASTLGAYFGTSSASSDFKANWIIAISGLTLSIFSAYTIVMIIQSNVDKVTASDFHEELRALSRGLGTFSIVTRPELYERMTKALQSLNGLEDEVLTTSFIPTNPNHPDNPRALRRYHEEFYKLIQEKRFTAKRITSVQTPEKLDWINEMIEKIGGRRHFELSWHKESSKLADDTIIPLNVQLIGRDNLFIIHPRVNVGYEVEDDKAKCFHIISEKAVKLFKEYFYDLWVTCPAILHGDRIEFATRRAVESFVEEQHVEFFERRLQSFCSELDAKEHLTTFEISEAIRRLAPSEKALSKHLITPGAGEPYGRKKLNSDTSKTVEVMVANWAAHDGCFPHDHGDARGWVYIVEGTTENVSYKVQTDTDGLILIPYESGTYEKGKMIDVGHRSVHMMENKGRCLITLHVYTPLPDAMRVYDKKDGLSYKVPNTCGAWNSTQRIEPIKFKMG